MLQYGFCQDVYYMNAPGTPKETVVDEETEEPIEVRKYADRLAAPDGPKTADAALGWFNEETGTDYEAAADYTKKYTFGDPLFKPYDLENLGGRDGYYDSVSLMLVSKEKCAEGTDDEPFTITFELHCGEDLTDDEGESMPFEWYGPLWPGKRAF
jgi:hypothetical protein